MNPIVGIGELLWDVYPDGRKVAGGAPFNFAFHCHQLGHPAAIVSRVGDDELGRELRDRVRELGLSDEFIQTDRDHPTGTVQLTLDANKVPTYSITENVAWDYLPWTPELSALSDEIAVICHGMLALRSPATRRTVEQLVRKSVRPKPARSALRVLDVNLRHPRPDSDLVYHTTVTADWVKVNGDEMTELARVFDQPPDQLMRLQYQMSGRDRTVWLMTDGPNGVSVRTLEPSAGERFREPGVPARVVDTVGAGDAFTAAMVCLHLEGRPLRECARFANHYAARVCEHQGATPRIDRREVERAAFARGA